MGWCWWGRWWDGQHGGGSGVRPRMRLSGRGESRFVRAPSEVDFSSHYRKYETFWPNCQIEETLPTCLKISQSNHWPFWSNSFIHIAGNGGNVYFWNILERGKIFYLEKLLKRGRKHWIDVGEGREVLPIKADGDGFAQEVRLHLFYYCTQKEMLRDAQASLEKPYKSTIYSGFWRSWKSIAFSIQLVPGFTPNC